MRRVLFVIFISSFALPSLSFAYSTDTHAYLTAEIFSSYNKNFTDLPIPDSWKSYLLDGSRREDDQFRALNHFYDPVYNRGFTSPLLGSWNKSPDWAMNETLQNQSKYKTAATVASMLTAAEQDNLGLVSAETDYAWDRGIRAYARGDTAKAAFVLGHILHLIEDLGVPEHTRNEAHPRSSPYENWTSRFSIRNPDNILEPRLDTTKPISFVSLSGYFSGLATYSNNNFYSQNTIGIQSGYPNPTPDFITYINGRSYGAKEDGAGLQILYLQKGGSGSMLINYAPELTLDNEEVLQDYWSRLAPKVVEYGAGVMRLFIEEGEKAKNNPNFVKDDPKSFLGKAMDTIGKLVSAGIDGAKGLIGKSKNTAEAPSIADLPADNGSQKVNALSAPDEFPAEPSLKEAANKDSENTLSDFSVAVQAAAEENTKQSMPDASNQTALTNGNETQASPPIAIYNPGNMAPVSVVLPAVQVTLPPNNPAPVAEAELATATSTEIIPETASSTMEVATTTTEVATTTLPDATTTISEPSATSSPLEHLILALSASTTSSSTLHFEWTLAEGITATSSLAEAVGSSTLPLYTGTSTAFDYSINPESGNTLSFVLTADYNGYSETATTTVILPVQEPEPPPTPPPGTVANLQWSADPATRTVEFTAELWSVNPQSSSRLELKFRRADSTLDGPADLASGYVPNGESASITIPMVSDGSYHWIARIGDADGGMSLWQAEASGEIVIPRPPVLASNYWGPSNFPNGYCHFGKSELIPLQDINVSSVEFWASCVNGDCSAPNTFQIYDATGTTLLAESDGGTIRFGYPDFNWAWENFTGPNRITLKAGEIYRVTPHSYHGQCMVNPSDPEKGAFYIR